MGYLYDFNVKTHVFGVAEFNGPVSDTARG
jgi:hypothetical protein